MQVSDATSAEARVSLVIRARDPINRSELLCRRGPVRREISVNEGRDGATGGNAAQAIRLRALSRIADDDLERVRELGAVIGDRLGSVVTHFYEWMRPLPEFEEFFSDPSLLERVRALQTEYWAEFLVGSIDASFVASRRSLGAIHARIGLPLDVYLGGMNAFFASFMRVGVAEGENELGPAHLGSLSKLLHLDTSIVVGEYNTITNMIIEQQGDALLQMSTPVTEVWDDILMLPLVGFIDSRRAMEVMNTMLAKIGQSRARVAILDISGVEVIDTAVANHLIKVTRATQLMGCECIISGISPSIAQTIVELGIDVGVVRSTATLQDALGMAFEVTGQAVRRTA
jgi:rsbT co-antagonist protein RsbR